jgi:hypothetical protein
MAADRAWLGLAAAAIGVGLVGGVIVGAATLALSNADIGGPGWSLRGNGALIVEFALGPAVLAGGWLWLVRGRLGPAVTAAVLTLLIELGVGFAPILLLARSGPAAGTPLPAGSDPAAGTSLVAGSGPAAGTSLLAGSGPPAATSVLVGLVPAVLACLVGLALAPPRTRGALLASLLVALVAVALSLGLPFLLFVLAPLLLPLVVVAPTVARYADKRALPALFALPVALVAGTFLPQLLLAAR